MTPEFVIGVLLSGMVATIGFFLKNLVQETRNNTQMTAAMNSLLENATKSIIKLQEADQETNKQLIGIVERLVRLEERSSLRDAANGR